VLDGDRSVGAAPAGAATSRLPQLVLPQPAAVQ
jgi:hypothetical protein